MRYSDFKICETKLLEQDANDEAKELVHKTGNTAVLATVVKFLRNLVAKQGDDKEQKPAGIQAMIDAGNKKADAERPNDPNATIESKLDSKNLINEDAANLKTQAMALLDQIGDADESKLLAIISFLRQNEIYDLCNAAIQANISQGVKENLDRKLGQMIIDLDLPFEAKEEFLQELGTGEGLWPGSDLINNITGNIYSKLENNPVAGRLAKPIALQLRGKMGYGPDQGPGEFLLALTGGGIDLAEKSDLVLIDGNGVEVKADSTSINKDGKKSRAGGRLYATKGYNGGSGARGIIKQGLLEVGIPEEALTEFGWNGKEPDTKYNNLNFNKAGIANLNNLLREYTQPGAAEKVLEAIANGFYTELQPGMANNFINNSSSGNQIDFAKAITNFVALGHEYYQYHEGHDYIMIFNTESGNYVMIKTGEDMVKAVEKGLLKIQGGMDYFDDRSKGTPQILTGKL